MSQVQLFPPLYSLGGPPSMYNAPYNMHHSMHHPPLPQSAGTVPRPAKRARTDDGESAPSPPTAYSPEQLTEMLASLTPAVQAKLLIEAATSSPTIAGKIASAHNAKVKRDQAKAAREAAKPQDFWPLYMKAMDQMLVGHEHLSEPRQRTKGFDVAFAIDDMLATIVSKTEPESSWETKFNALYTIREIFSMMDENGMIPRVVRQNCFDWGPKLVAVVETFDEEELERLRAVSVKTAEGKTDLFINLFEQVVRMTEAFCIEDYLCTREAWGLLMAGSRNGGEEEVGERAPQPQPPPASYLAPEPVPQAAVRPRAAMQAELQAELRGLVQLVAQPEVVDLTV